MSILLKLRMVNDQYHMWHICKADWYLSFVIMVWRIYNQKEIWWSFCL